MEGLHRRQISKPGFPVRRQVGPRRRRSTSSVHAADTDGTSYGRLRRCHIGGDFSRDDGEPVELDLSEPDGMPWRTGCPTRRSESQKTASTPTQQRLDHERRTEPATADDASQPEDPPRRERPGSRRGAGVRGVELLSGDRSDVQQAGRLCAVGIDGVPPGRVGVCDGAELEVDLQGNDGRSDV